MNVLILAEGAVDRPRGPVIRALGLARALAPSCAVTVAAREGTAPGHRSAPYTRASLLREAHRQDVVIAPWIPPYLLAGLPGVHARMVADLYDPLDLELEEADGDGELAHVQRLTALQVRLADAFLCGSEAQRTRLDRAFAASDRDAATVAVVPFGLDPPPERSARRPLRERLAFGADDPVVLWWGSLWRWLDPGTAIEAAARLEERVPRLRLVFTAGKTLHAKAHELDFADEARELARGAGLLDRSVFFLDEWIPYDRRHEYLQDADLGLTLHRDDAEADLAVRARYLDFLWCRLPCVLSTGDPFSRRLAGCGLATLVPTRDPAAVAEAIAERLRAPRPGPDVDVLAEALRWEAVGTPLRELLHEPSRAPGRRARDRAAAVAGFYGARVRRRLRTGA